MPRVRRRLVLSRTSPGSARADYYSLASTPKATHVRRPDKQRMSAWWTKGRSAVPMEVGAPASRIEAALGANALTPPCRGYGRSWQELAQGVSSLRRQQE